MHIETYKNYYITVTSCFKNLGKIAQLKIWLYTEYMTLSALQATSGKYTLLEFDRPFGLALAAGEPASVPPSDQLKELISKAANELFSPVSGVVLDSRYTYNTINQKPHEAGVVFSLEDQTESLDPLSLPHLADNWGVEYVRNNYGVAKLELYYHPAEELAHKKQQFVAEIKDFCVYQHIDLILQLFVYHPMSELPEAAILQETQLLSVHDFARSCDMLAIEYLGDPLNAATITADIDIPWILTSRSTNYEATKNDLRAALESGAQGFMLGDVFWPSVSAKQQSVEQALVGVQTTSRDRLLELSRIVNEWTL